ncbi:hypothetical protein GWD52_09605 [Enterobacteriaceae bacterium 4M9]|nr:hypothetical protein [Enterobacteriaceae bacterium 4M9]
MKIKWEISSSDEILSAKRPKYPATQDEIKHNALPNDLRPRLENGEYITAARHHQFLITTFLKACEVI